MDRESLKGFADTAQKLNDQLKVLLSVKQELAKTIAKHLEVVVIPQLNEEIKPSGYFFRDKQSVSFLVSGTFLIELYPLVQEWWSHQDWHYGWVDVARAQRLTVLVNSTDTICELKKDFPHLTISVRYSYSGNFAETERGS